MSYLNDWWRVFFGGMEYPYTDSCKYNDDWLLEVVKKLVEEFANFVNLNKIKYADPIGWDITRQYEANTVVVDNRTGNAYISSKPVPAGVQISNTTYWTEIYNYARVIDTLREQIAYNAGDTTTAPKPLGVGGLVFVSGELYRVISPMIAGDSFVVDSNIVKTTVEAEILRVAAALYDEASARANADTQLANSISNEATARANADTALEGSIAGVQRNVDTLYGYIDKIDSKLKKWDVTTNGKIIFLGDSYGKWSDENWDKWTDNVARLLDLGDEDINWFNLAEPSMALASGSFLSILQTWVENNADELDNIGAVVCCGGVNDADSSYIPQLYTALSNLASYIKQHLPNATPYIGFIGWLDESTVPSDARVARLRYQVAQAYFRSVESGWRYLNGVENAYHDKRIVVDGIHPTADGATRIAECVVNALTTGDASVVYDFSANISSGNIGTSAGTIQQVLQNGWVSTHLDNLGVLFSVPVTLQAGTQYSLGIINTSLSNGVDFGTIDVSMTVEDSANITAHGRLYIDKHTLNIVFLIYQFSDGLSAHAVSTINGIYADSVQNALLC